MPITNCCVLADSLSEESVKDLCSAAWNGDLYVDLKAAKAVHKFTVSLQGIFIELVMESGYFNNGNFREFSYFGEGNFAVLKREFPVALFRMFRVNLCYLL